MFFFFKKYCSRDDRQKYFINAFPKHVATLLKETQMQTLLSNQFINITYFELEKPGSDETACFTRQRCSILTQCISTICVLILLVLQV